MTTCKELDICKFQKKILNDNYSNCNNYNLDINNENIEKKCKFVINNENENDIIFDIGKLYSNNKKNDSVISNKCWEKVVFSDEKNNNYLQYVGVGINENKKINKYCCKITDYNLNFSLKNLNNNPYWHCVKINSNSDIKQSYDDSVKKKISLNKIMRDYNVINQSGLISNYDSNTPEMKHFMNNMCCISDLKKLK